MVKIKKKAIQVTTATKEKIVLQPSPPKPTKPRRAAKRREQPSATSKGKARADSSAPVAGTRSATKTAAQALAPAPSSASRPRESRVLPDEESEGRESAEDMEEVESDDPDRQLGLRPTLRVVSKATREMEAMLVPDLEHIRDLELRLEQEQMYIEKLTAKRDEAELANFREKKQALDQRTRELQRSKLHPLLRGSSLSTSMAALCKADNDHGHLSVADQRLLSLMPKSRDEDFSGTDHHESAYNPDQDLSINKVSKRLGSRLSVIEKNGEGLDPLLQLITVAKDRIRELSAVTPTAGTT
ncbi:hypothetical protein BGZ68_001836 [Mortierella alpina]|nr:hypothetical protein BGZ68_001836 [Mortierella alpina]